MVFNKVLELNGIFKKIVERKERNILRFSWEIVLLLPPLANPKQSKAATSFLLKPGSSKGLTCLALLSISVRLLSDPSSLPSLPTPFVNVNHFLMSPVVVNFTPFFSLWTNLGVNGTGLGTTVCLWLSVSKATGCLWKKSRRRWRNLRNETRKQFKSVSFLRRKFVLLATFRCVFRK